MSNENEILTIAGKEVVVMYSNDSSDCCGRCAFWDNTCRLSLSCQTYDKNSKYAYFVEAPQEKPHSLREWAQILATNPGLRAEFDKICPPQPIQGSIAPEPAVNKFAVAHAFLKCDRAGKIVSEMYGDKFDNLRNRDKYLTFLRNVNFDDRFGELAEILQRYGAMPAPKEQPDADLDAEIFAWQKAHATKETKQIIAMTARHFAEWGAEHLKK